MTAPTYVLVAEDFSGRADEDVLLARLGVDALAVERTTRTVTARGETRTVPGLRITVRGGFLGVRNTVAHGIAVGAGFVTHID